MAQTDAEVEAELRKLMGECEIKEEQTDAEVEAE
eukprot:COSAG01_NODE_65185_length_274_cov_0.582857_1_plen_33_part_01